MKLKITYLPGEERQAEALHNVAKELLKPVKVQRSDRHPPFKHIYIATEKQLEPSCNSGGNVV